MLVGPALLLIRILVEVFIVEGITPILEGRCQQGRGDVVPSSKSSCQLPGGREKLKARGIAVRAGAHDAFDFR
jgi:hypothetical protein